MERGTIFFGVTEQERIRRKEKIDQTYTPYEEKPTECIVCMEDIENIEVLKLKPCHHIVHRACFTTWTHTRQSMGRPRICPVCNSAVQQIINIEDEDPQNVPVDQHMNNFMNIQFTVRALLNAIAAVPALPGVRQIRRGATNAGQQFGLVVRNVAEFYRNRPYGTAEFLIVALNAGMTLTAIGLYLNVMGNHIYNRIFMGEGKSRKHHKTKKTIKTIKRRKRRKVKKH
jgi:hypothetical protein